MRWREVFKFLSGAAFAGAIANLYLWAVDASLPFLGYTITPGVFGLRGLVSVFLCAFFFYLGWRRK
jgi:hypothetical protein